MEQRQKFVFPSKARKYVRCMRSAAPMLFVATRRHPAVIRQRGKRTLWQNQDPNSLCCSSSLEGKRERGRVSTIAASLPPGHGQLRAPGAMRNRRLSRQRKRGRKEQRGALSLTTQEPAAKLFSFRQLLLNSAPIAMTSYCLPFAPHFYFL